MKMMSIEALKAHVDEHGSTAAVIDDQLHRITHVGLADHSRLALLVGDGGRFSRWAYPWERVAVDMSVTHTDGREHT